MLTSVLIIFRPLKCVYFFQWRPGSEFSEKFKCLELRVCENVVNVKKSHSLPEFVYKRCTEKLLCTA